jgi:putative polysaccharide export protein (PEP-CTERM system associated)
MKKTIFIALTLLLLAITTISAEAENYRLGPDDALKITVYREEELEREVRVSSDGYISFPLLGKVQAEGLTISELEDKLTEGLKKYLKKPQVTVYIEEYSTITVSGQVEAPGAYPLKGELTVIEAISLAGGFTKIAARNDVKIMRIEDGKKKSIRVKVADISQKGDMTRDISLQRGDIVFVPESLF